MPYAGRDWDKVDSTNRLPYSYDFQKRIDSSDSIASVSWELVPVPGDSSRYRAVDPNPLDRIVTTSNTRTVATVWLESLIPNCRYRLTAFITTDEGVQDDLWAYIYCDPRP